MELRPEARLLLACVATGEGAPNTHLISQLARPDLDWAWFVRAARIHAVLPIVHRRLAGAGIERHDLRAHAVAVACRNLRLTAELVALSRAFDGRGIPMLAWKGPSLAVLAWGDVSLREFRDLDLVVPPEAFEPASELLIAHGYRPLGTVAGQRARTALRHGYNHSFLHPELEFRVELHWRFTPGALVTGLSSREALAARQVVKVGSGVVASLGPIDLLISLAEHGTRHGWERLGWIADVGQLGADPRLDWEAALARSRALGSERMLLLAAVLAHGLLDYRFPDQVMRRADRHRPLAILREWVISHLFEEQSLETGPWDKKVFALRARERMGDRVRMIGDSILGVTAADWDAWSLPDGLHGLYYLARPFRVSWRYGAKFFEALSRR